MDYEIPKEGSLGLLALGARGLDAWRQKRGENVYKPFNFSSSGGSKKVLLIGWDAADWKVINPLINAGKLPALKKLIETGVSGNISTLEPALSPMLWTSIATGKLADKHGILGFTEPNPNTGTVRPVSSTSRKARALWNILSHQGLKCHVVGWWPSHPAEPINGISISNHYQRAHQPIDKPWPIVNGMVHPKDYASIFKSLRIHPDELTEAHILPFIPKAASVDQEKDPRLGSLSKILADCSTIHNAATWIMENEDWDFLGVYYDAIDHFSHGFMKFHPPQLPGLPDEMFEIYKSVIEGAYIYHDMMLERLLNLSGKDTHVILLSDHGFKSDHLRPIEIPEEPSGPAIEHRQFGVLCMNGPAIKNNDSIYGSTLLDITPTILSLFDLPVGKDMDGTPLLQAFSKEVEVSEIETWEKVEGDFGEHDNSFVEDPFVSKQAFDQLVELGYVEEIGEDYQKGIRIAETERQYNLAQVYLSTERAHLALPILEQLYGENAEKRFGLKLIWCYRSIGKIEEGRKIFNELKLNEEKRPTSFNIIEASFLIDEGRENEALKLLEEVREKAQTVPELYLHAGRCYISLEKYDLARQSFLQGLVLDPDKAMTHYGLGLCALRLGEYEKAVEALLNALGLVFQFPVAHYHLGEALYYLKEFEQAIECFQVALRMSPGMQKANQFIERIKREETLRPSNYKRKSKNFELFNKEKIEQKRSGIKNFTDKSKGEIIVVSGLPRSGTSLMMKMLSEGGLDPFTDFKRKADESNPNGYFEHELVKRIQHDKKWLNQAIGKCLKVVAPLVLHLPRRFKYKVIFMERDLDEVLSSQHKMMAFEKKIQPNEFRVDVDLGFKNALKKSKFWAENSINVEVIYIDYAELISNSDNSINKLLKFLDLELDIEKMKNSIDLKLHRNRKKKKI